jgi:hypothetical protein
MSTRHIDIRVFAEGVRIPALSVTRSQQRVGGVSFSISIPPTTTGFAVLPGTYIHVFARRREGKSERFVLFAEGRVVQRNASIVRQGGRALELRCAGLDAGWAHIPIGTDMGFDMGGFPRPRLKAFFQGLSPAKPSESVIPQHDFVMDYAVYRFYAGGMSSQNDYFFSLESSFDAMIQADGPALAVAKIIANLPAIHPLERQSMLATRFHKRLVAIENSKFTEHLKTASQYEAIFGRIAAMPSSWSVRQIIDHILPRTYHHQFSIASPYFNRAMYEGAATESVTDEFLDAGEVAHDTPWELPQAPISAREVGAVGGGWPSSYYEEWEFDCRAHARGTSQFQKVPSKYKSNVYRLASNLDVIASYAGARAVTVISGWRSVVWNADPKVGGASNSQHLLGKAADLQPPAGMTPSQLFLLIDWLMRTGRIDRGGLGLYPSRGFVHYDIRGGDVGAWLDAKDQRGGNTSPYSYATSKTRQTGEEIAKAVDYNDANHRRVRQETADAGVMPSFVIKPNLQFAPPPLSNVFFGNMVTTCSASEDFNMSFTRMMMSSKTLITAAMERSNHLVNQFNPLYFMPLHLQGLIDKLVEHPSHSDIVIPGDPTSSTAAASAIQEDLVDMSGATPNLQEPSEAMTTIYAEQVVNGEKRDAMSALIDKPSGLLSAYTYEELFRGVRPSVGELPFMQQDTDPEKWVALYGGYTQAMLSRQGRMISLSMPLNLNVVVGFSGAFYDETMGWILGEVQSVQDSVTATGVAVTNVTLGGCAFYGDLDNPYWKRIYSDSTGHFDNYDMDGVQAPELFDEVFSPSKIGTSIYEGVLGIGSVIDLAKRIKGVDTMTLRGALLAIQEAQQSAENPTEWADAATHRLIATEGEVMQLVLEAEPVGNQSTEALIDQTHERYGSAHHIHQWPDGAQFAIERRFWAEDYRRDLEARDYAVDVIAPTNDALIRRKVALPNAEASESYEATKNIENVQPRINYITGEGT